MQKTSFTSRINKERATHQTTTHTPISIGIHSGMGPLAGYAFSQRFQALLSQHYADNPLGDASHPTILTYSDTHTPPRDKSIDSQEQIIHHLEKGVKLFQDANVNFILAPCNTLMHFKHVFTAKNNIKLVDIMEATAEYTRTHHPHAKKVGLLSKAATSKSGLYHRALAHNGLETVILSNQNLAILDDVIHDVKEGRHLSGHASELLKKVQPCIAELEAQGVDAIILGCTELPLLLTEAPTQNQTPLISSIEALAQKGIQELALIENTPSMKRPYTMSR